MKIASAKLEDAKISPLHSIVVCRAIKGKQIVKAKNLLENLIEQKVSLDGKYYTKATKQILEVLENAEANARAKGLDESKLFVKIAKADKGYKFLRPRSRWRLRGRKAKMTNVSIVLEER